MPVASFAHDVERHRAEKHAHIVTAAVMLIRFDISTGFILGLVVDSAFRLCAAVQQYPPQVTMNAAEMEAKMVLFDVVEQVLAATGLKACEVCPFGAPTQ